MVNILAVGIVHKGALTSDFQGKNVTGSADTDQLCTVDFRFGDKARNLTVSVDEPASQVLEHHEGPCHVFKLLVLVDQLSELSTARFREFGVTYSEA